MKKFIVILSLFITAAPFIKAQQSAFYDNSCTVTDRYFNPLRNILSGKDGILQPVPLSDISPWFVLSVLAAEDKRFFEHGGVDVKAAARALWQNVSGGKVVSGASTITQQLVGLNEPKRKSFTDKIKEAFAAKDMEREMSKDEILEKYFNSVNLGGNIYGAEAASRVYFNTSAASLSLSQSAFLAGIIKSPVNYNPYKNYEAALKRRDLILKRMVDDGFINKELYDIAILEKIVISSAYKPFLAPHYSEFISSKMKDLCKGKIKTTIDGKIQAYIEGLLPVYTAKFEKNKLGNSAVVVLDNATGDILAMVGSADYFDVKNNGYVNGALALRQPGSALKPFVYAQYFEQGALPSERVEDKDKFFAGGFRPRNYDEDYHGNPTLRVALACSYNIPVVQVAEKLGTGKILDVLKNVGFTSLNKSAQDYGLGIALGNGEVTLLELANAYRTLANNGVWSPVRYVLDPVSATQDSPRKVFSEETAYMVTNVLSDNDARSAAFGLNSPLNMPFDFAAKTGTSKDYRDNWTAGYNQRFTVAVWTGNFDGTPMRRVSGITGAAPLMRDIAMFLENNYPAKILSNKTSFIKPQNIVRVEVCPVSGKLPGHMCGNTVAEVFPVAGRPKEVCMLSENEHQGKAEIASPSDGILFPSAGDIFMMDPSTPAGAQQLNFKASGHGKWYINGRILNCSGDQCFWRIEPGKFKLELKTNKKNYSVNFEVLK